MRYRVLIPDEDIRDVVRQIAAAELIIDSASAVMKRVAAGDLEGAAGVAMIVGQILQRRML